MLVSDLVEMVLLRSGHLYIDDLSYLLVKDRQFLEIVKDAVRTGRKYQTMKRDLVVSLGGFDLSSTVASVESRYTFTEQQDVIVPDYIYEIFEQKSYYTEFSYRKPELIIFNSTRDIVCVEAGYKYYLRKLTDLELPDDLESTAPVAAQSSNPQGFSSKLPIIDLRISDQKISGASPAPDPNANHYNLRTWDLVGLTDPSDTSGPNIDAANEFDLFLDLLTAKFMIAVGRSRGQFALREAPVEVSWQEMVADGKELQDATLETMKINVDVFYDVLSYPGI